MCATLMGAAVCSFASTNNMACPVDECEAMEMMGTLSDVDVKGRLL